MSTRRESWPWLLLLPAALVMLVAFALPVGMLLARAFTQPEPGLQNFLLLWERPVYLQILGNTVMIAAVATPVTLLLAYPVAHAMAHGNPRMSIGTELGPQIGTQKGPSCEVC
ncbi:hypothetical protein APZ41_016330 [Roseomonas mucosa]|uniref:ABC transporter permease n=1 Tax=Roseomonas mucosa TaxID=207340 RepID=A0A1S8D1D4_9PROT|nr:hypothetical protein [Roseomonas mucosa]ONH82123.1 hypothetical protein APZ41_016330 [Roseomonas mucosa]